MFIHFSKYLLIMLCIGKCSNKALAQTYSVYANFGTPYTLTQTTTLSSLNQKVKVSSPITKAGNIGIQKKVGRQFFIGIGVGIEDFEFSQKTRDAGFQNGTFGFRSMGLGSPVVLLEGQLRLGYIVSVSNRSKVNFILTPKVCYFPNGGTLKDTTESNTYERENATSNYLYLNINQTLKTGLIFLANVAAEYELKLGQSQRFSLTAAIAYQQGFRDFATYTSYMGQPNVSEGVYTTTVNGSNIQLNFGMRYNFGFKEKVSMLGKFN